MAGISSQHGWGPKKGEVFLLTPSSDVFDILKEGFIIYRLALCFSTRRGPDFFNGDQDER
jgi:hypothetical protein